MNMQLTQRTSQPGIMRPFTRRRPQRPRSCVTQIVSGERGFNLSDVPISVRESTNWLTVWSDDQLIGLRGLSKKRPQMLERVP